MSSLPFLCIAPDVPTSYPYQKVRIVLCVVLAICVSLFVVGTIHWPLVNDPSQIDYVCFMMDHGMSPYKDMIEMNMPGIYLVNWTVMHTLGGGPFAWRAFDFALMGAAALAMIAIAWPYDWFGGVFGASLFILFHGRDGPAQAGQRDLVIAVLLVCAYAFLFHALRKGKAWPMFFFGMCAAAAATIKPTPLPFALLLLAIAAFRLKRLGKPMVPPVVLAFAGMCVPLTVVGIFLAQKHALGEFIYVMRKVLPYYAHLGRHNFAYLLDNSMTSSIVTLIIIALAIAAFDRSWKNWETITLLLGVAFGVLSYFAQGKGFPYHRYPMLAFIMLCVGLMFTSALRKPGMVRALGMAGLAFGVIVAPLYAQRAHRRYWDEAFIYALSGDLSQLGGIRLSGHVQCIYMPADCDTALYRMQLVQSTGLFYDYFIFGPSQHPVIEEYRSRFWRELQGNPPRVIVIGQGLYPDDLDDYRKLNQWPQFETYLYANYVLYDERAFKPSDPGPRGFRVYVQKNESQLDGNKSELSASLDKARMMHESGN